MKPKEKTELKYIVRIANTDLEGSVPIKHSLTKIKGVSYPFANMVCSLAGVEKKKKTGLLSDDEVKKLNDVLNDPLSFGAPAWMLNHRKDFYTGADKHITGPDLRFLKETEIRRLRRIKCYRGVRHSSGLPVRGQRTRANFRKKKGTGSLGVKRRKGAKAGRV